MHANHREEIDTVYAGDIAAAVGLKDTFTGDTLTDEAHPVLLESITFPEPVIEVKIEPKTKADQDKLTIALQRLSEEDPTFRVHTDPESSETLIAGMGELHLDVLVDRMIREFKVAANIGKPQVSYRETIRRAAEGNGRFVRQTGGKGQYGHAVIKLEPAEKGAGYEFVDKIVGGTIPREFIKSVDQGIREKLETGHLRRVPGRRRQGDAVRRVVPRGRLVRDGVQDRRFDGGPGRVQQGRSGHPRADHAGRGDDARRSSWATSSATSTAGAARSRASSPRMRHKTQVVRAFVPLAQMFGYVTDLRSMSQGRATSSMEFSHYAEVPASLASELVQKSKV